MSEDQSYIGTTTGIFEPPSTLQINGSHSEMLVAIKPDGTIKYGPDYTPDEAARAFWEALGTRSPYREKLAMTEDIRLLWEEIFKLKGEIKLLKDAIFGDGK